MASVPPPPNPLLLAKGRGQGGADARRSRKNLQSSSHEYWDDQACWRITRWDPPIISPHLRELFCGWWDTCLDLRGRLTASRKLITSLFFSTHTTGRFSPFPLRDVAVNHSHAPPPPPPRSHGCGLLDAVEADPGGGRGDGHGSGHAHAEAVVVLPAVPPLPDGRAHLQTRERESQPERQRLSRQKKNFQDHDAPSRVEGIEWREEIVGSCPSAWAKQNPLILFLMFSFIDALSKRCVCSVFGIRGIFLWGITGKEQSCDWLLIYYLKSGSTSTGGQFRCNLPVKLFTSAIRQTDRNK